MKKIISLLLALVMVMGLGVTAFADGSVNQTGVPTDSNATITANYEAGSTTHKHGYRVTVAWKQTGTIQYKDAVTVYDWNTGTLTYDKNTTESADPKWTCTDAKVAITVTNYSDQGIKADFAKPAAKGPVTDISGEYDKNTLSLGTANNQAGENKANKATEDVAIFTINDVKGTMTKDDSQIGTITVSLSIPASEQP